MTANHAHTPSMYHIRDQFIEAWAGDFVFGKVDAAKYFDRALDAHNARIEAAAEQRGAERGWVEGVLYAHEQHNNHAGLSPSWKFDNPYRADREGDDEYSTEG